MSSAQKFPGSWSRVLALSALIAGAQVAGVAVATRLRGPVAAAPSADRRAAGMLLPPPVPVGDAEALLEQYAAEFTPELDERTRSYAASLGIDAATVPPAREIFRTLVAGSLLKAPEGVLGQLPKGADRVCGERGPSYVCVMIALHLDTLAQWSGVRPGSASAFPGAPVVPAQ